MDASNGKLSKLDLLLITLLTLSGLGLIVVIKSRRWPLSLTSKILIGMLSGMALGVLLHNIPSTDAINTYFIDGLLEIGGNIFIAIMKMLVVPIVLVSLICGVCNLGDPKKLGRIGIKTLLLYLFTTALAITLGLLIASLVNIGAGNNLTSINGFTTAQAPSLKETLMNIIPTNPFNAMVEGNMLQIIVFSLLFGSAITLVGSKGERIVTFFNDMNEILIQLISMLIHAAPYGVFCLIASLFATMGLSIIGHLIGYFVTVAFTLILHLLISNSILLRLFARLNPFIFFRKMYSAMMFAFSTSSSNVSIPIVLDTVKRKLGVRNAVASFVIPLGATINMDGTAIMQGVATVFIANSYNIDIGVAGYFIMIITATLASIGTAGVPGVGLITLAMVLKQVGLPVEGIALIIGVDRLLDMLRTAVNVTGDAAIACVVGKSEKAFNEKKFLAKIKST